MPDPSPRIVLRHLVDGKRRSRTFDKPVVRIGSVAAFVDLHLEQDHRVSQVHAVLTVLPGGGIELTDLGSPWGTSVDGKPIGRATLHRGDAFQIGGTEVVLESGPDATDAPRRVEPPSRWRRLLQVSGWYQERLLGVVALSFFASLALTGVGLLGATLYGCVVWAWASPGSFAVVFGIVAMVGFGIVALSRRCPACKRWFALEVVSKTWERRAGSARGRGVYGEKVTVSTERIVQVRRLRCRHCGESRTR